MHKIVSGKQCFMFTSFMADMAKRGAPFAAVLNLTMPFRRPLDSVLWPKLANIALPTCLERPWDWLLHFESHCQPFPAMKSPTDYYWITVHALLPTHTSCLSAGRCSNVMFPTYECAMPAPSLLLVYSGAVDISIFILGLYKAASSDVSRYSLPCTLYVRHNAHRKFYMTVMLNSSMFSTGAQKV